MNNGDIFQEEFEKLEQQVSNLKTTFVDTLSLSLTPTEQDKTFTKAFCVLFHASLEDFFEKIAQNVLQKSINAYKNITFVTTSDMQNLELLNEKIQKQVETYVLLVTYASLKGVTKKPINIVKAMDSHIDDKYPKNNTQDITSEFFKSDNDVSKIVNTIFDDSKTIIDDMIEEKNNGTSLKHIMSILHPVGVDINGIFTTMPTKLSQANSIRKLAYHRGDYAHLNQNTKISTLLSKTDLEEIIEDCMKLCKTIKNLAIARF
jgi:hypothetical protein